MKFTIHKNLIEKVPLVREGLLILKDFDNSSESKLLMQVIQKAENSLREKKSVDTDWQKSYEKVGIDAEKFLPSHIALSTRVLDGKLLPDINPIVNVINAIQLEKQLPIGAHDMDKMQGNITVGANENQFTFKDRKDGEIKVNEDEIVHADEKEVLTRNWTWRQGTKDLSDSSSKNIVIFINSVNEKDNLEKIAADIVAYLEQHNNKKVNARFGILSAKTPELDTDKMAEFTDRSNELIKPKPLSQDPKLIERILNKATEEVLPTKEALEKLLKSGRRLRIYQGFDPTADTLHIGHSVMMHKLEDFRKLGHQVIFLMGNFTGTIGDPTDKKATRKQLTLEQTNKNLAKYKKQASAIIDIDNKDNPVEVLFNADWLGKMSFGDVIELSKNFTVQQMIKRSMFQKRLEEDKPIGLHEFLYPLMQGYDSVAMDVDIEVGGNDQLFNMMAGRTLMHALKNKEKFVITGKLLTTAEGTKMGKSEGNMIKLSDSGRDIYGKVMAFPDEHIVPGFELLTSASLDEVSQMQKRMDEGENPIILKKELAFRLTKELKGENEANDGQKFFEDAFQNKDTESAELEELTVKATNILDVLVEIGFAQSKSVARRLVEQGAVSIDGEKVTKWDYELSTEGVLKVGKKICKLIIS